MEEFGLYRHLSEPVYLADTLATSVGTAIQKARDFNDRPLLLAVPASSITSNLRPSNNFKNHYLCDFLDTEWYLQLDLELREGKLTSETVEKLEQIVFS